MRVSIATHVPKQQRYVIKLCNNFVTKPKGHNSGASVLTVYKVSQQYMYRDQLQ